MELTSLLDQSNIIPAKNIYGNTYWLEETIWGHRLWYRQGKWLLFLEMLNIAAGRSKNGTPFGSSVHEAADTIPSRDRLLLRYLLFRNSEIESFAQKNRPESEHWDRWTQYFSVQLEDDEKRDLSFLKERFTRFKDFAAAIKLLRETMVHPLNSTGDGTSERRWTSFFVFPFGDAAIYQDLDEAFKPDATRFGRTGDILYQMLARASRATDLIPLFSELINTDKQITKLLRKLQDPGADQWAAEGRMGSYLPYRSHPSFDRLAEDWISIRGRNQAAYDAYEHYVRLAALHVFMYHIETAAAWCGGQEVVFVCEVLGGPSSLRRASVESFQRNEGMSTLALEAAWNRLLTCSELSKLREEIKTHPVEDQVSEVREFLNQKIQLSDGEHKHCSSVEDLFNEVWEHLEAKAEGNVGLIHRAYGRASGLVAMRGARVYRYVPSDALLKTIVLTNVPVRMEFRQFLELLYTRYKMVFGPAEAARSPFAADKEASVFEKNSLRLEERLHSMGLLNRLSDGVAFIENPTR